MKKLTAIICMIAVVGMMALTACSVEQALTSHTAPARTIANYGVNLNTNSCYANVKYDH